MLNKINKHIFIILILSIVLLLVPSITNAAKDIDAGHEDEIIKPSTTVELENLKDLIGNLTTVVTAFALTSSVLIFTIHFVRLGRHSSNPNKRSETLNNLLITGITTTVLGGIGLFVKLLLAIF